MKPSPRRWLMISLDAIDRADVVRLAAGRKASLVDEAILLDATAEALL